MNKFVETQNFGLNSLTTVFIITIIFTSLTAYYLIKQNNKIINDRKGESVNFILFCYYGFGGVGMIIYGYYKDSLALMVNGCAGFAALLVVISLLRFKEITLKEKILGFGIIILLPLIIYIKQKDLLYFLSGLTFNLVLGLQIWEIWDNETSGELHPGQIIINLLAAIFWTIYAFLTDLWPLEISGTISVCLWLGFLGSYIKFKPKTVNISSQSS